MSELKARIQEDVKTAMKNKDQRKVTALRLITAAMKQREVDERITLTDEQILVILDKMLKQRRDSLEQYEKAQRADLAQQEAYEIELIQSYLPTPLTEEELQSIIAAAITECGATSVKELGKVMTAVKPKVQGRTDMKAVSDKVKARLS